ncbi:MAG: butyrate kinase [Clostridiales bacterium]|nr:butyrate kinase [Clostridiales bacterium]
MNMRILAINPGSSSTKLAVYEGETPLFEESIEHNGSAVSYSTDPEGALAFRMQHILSSLAAHSVTLDSLDAVIGRGGMLHPIPGGVYTVNERMLADLQSSKYGDHASNMGAMLANIIGNMQQIPAFIADSVVTDELSDLARLSGHPEISRASVFHALNQKAKARRFCFDRGLKYDEINLIIAHIGGGATIGAHEKGRVIDVNDGLGGEGPYSAQRCGGLPTSSALRLMEREQLSATALLRKLNTKGGLIGYLGTDDGKEVSRRAQNGDERARYIFEGMAYQVSKEIGAYAAVLKGDVQAIILTGGFARDKMFTDWIAERTKFIAEIVVMPGEDEQQALCAAALRVLAGEEQPLVYV